MPAIFPPSNIRNVVLAGHNGVGKTSLAEALLANTKTILRQGKIDEGTTVCDFEPEELSHRMSLSLSLAPLELNGVKINLIDTPGYADFTDELRAACMAADLMAVVVSAVDGVQAQTRIAWEIASRLQIPRIVIVNKLDRERASFDRVLEELVSEFGAGMAPLELPLGEEHDFVGIADLLTDTATFYKNGSPSVGPIPEDISEREHQVRETLIEGIVVGDDTMMERYLDGEIPSPEQLEGTLAKGVADATVFPIICASASTGVGIDRIATLISELAPPGDTRSFAGTDGRTFHPDPNEPPIAVVFKTLSDPYVGRISLLRIVSGTLHPDCILVNSRTHAEERLHTLQMLRGKEPSLLTEASAGDIVAVPKLANTSTGDTLSAKGVAAAIPMPPPEPPVLSIAIRPRSKGDEDKLMTGIHRLQDEDRSIGVDHIQETRQTLLSGMGEMHLSVICERLHRKFGVDIEQEPVAIAYRETITKPSQAEGKYKKQSGGHGQFGIAVLRIEPLPRGGGFEFVDAIFGGAIPRQYLPAVEKGVLEAMAMGGPSGYPVVDVKVTCVDGKFHSVDSSELSFKMAGSLAFKEAVQKADPVVLEPISLVSVVVPSSMQGDILGDLNSRRGRVQGTETTPEGLLRITALVPISEIQRYAIDLRALTGARGRFIATHDHYDTLPSTVKPKVLVSAGH